ncbi:hypothetical protein M413DRAFT_445664, partial [Hebeloma cylindrosporum]
MGRASGLGSQVEATCRKEVWAGRLSNALKLVPNSSVLSVVGKGYSISVERLSPRVQMAKHKQALRENM